MNRLKKFGALLALILALSVAFAFVGCGMDGYGYDSGGYWYDKSESPSAPGDGDSMDEATGETGDDGDATDGSNSNQQKPIVKQLTAAEWRDAFNYDFWLNLFEKVPVQEQDGTETTQNGIFSSFAVATRGLDTFNMHEVCVTCGEEPVIGANVYLYDQSDVIYSAVTDSTGTAYVFGNGTRIEAVSGQYSQVAEISDGITSISINDFEAFEDELEIMFVVDTTGSMGDELSFLCDELAGIVTRVSSALDCKIRLGLLFYRDNGDEYVTKKFDFTDVNSASGLNTVVKNIRAQKASGGGDTPEAVDRALAEAVEANWHSNSKTRLLFHVLDAPYHDEQEQQSVFANAVKNAAQQGIRIIPVAASGFDTLGQYIMRSAALLTGGTYTFLTDDSGIGYSHEIPAVGEFTVEYLSDLMVRLIKGYYTGTFEEPILWSQSESIV